MDTQNINEGCIRCRNNWEYKINCFFLEGVYTLLKEILYRCIHLQINIYVKFKLLTVAETADDESQGGCEDNGGEEVMVAMAVH